ncbi:hypothetical protein T03_12215 [Trichinella britovi]|uniref:Uncharacterized protein n=1 Tax=Trichinella britovi TaxID=45882 RepID=A0A0V1C773_TRIBR|nr:hypothetical protein T03_12215 [Trichinella britovi]
MFFPEQAYVLTAVWIQIWLRNTFSVLGIITRYFAKAEIIKIIKMVLWIPSHHRHTKRKRFQCFRAISATAQHVRDTICGAKDLS